MLGLALAFIRTKYSVLTMDMQKHHSICKSHVVVSLDLRLVARWA